MCLIRFGITHRFVVSSSLADGRINNLAIGIAPYSSDTLECVG
jgi:hypothetical protein